MDLFRIILFDVSQISLEDGTYIDMHDDNYFPDSDENITYIKSDIINDIQYIFLLSDNYKINKLTDLLDSRLNYKIDNITTDFIESKNIEGLNLTKNKSFFNNYKLKYLSIDDILDKINNCGIDKLDEIDMKILKKDII
ncbi:MAG: hypothetical protein WDA02_10085 [Saccharofermentanales bacterium]|jgi:hypothetical protein